MLYHRYRLGADGTIEDAVIIPPTSQNQATIEEDLRVLIGNWLNLPEADLRWRCEQTVRNYDPCISCATHFLRLEIDRAYRRPFWQPGGGWSSGSVTPTAATTASVTR